MKRRTPVEWFHVWLEIIKEEGEVSPLQLSTHSKSSLWTIQRFRLDFLEMYPYVKYNEKHRRFYIQEKLNTLHTLTEKEKMKGK